MTIKYIFFKRERLLSNFADIIRAVRMRSLTTSCVDFRVSVYLAARTHIGEATRR